MKSTYFCKLTKQGNPGCPSPHPLLFVIIFIKTIKPTGWGAGQPAGFPA